MNPRGRRRGEKRVSHRRAQRPFCFNSIAVFDGGTVTPEAHGCRSSARKTWVILLSWTRFHARENPSHERKFSFTSMAENEGISIDFRRAFSGRADPEMAVFRVDCCAASGAVSTVALAGYRGRFAPRKTALTPTVCRSGVL